jgi:hypothetical protein
VGDTLALFPNQYYDLLHREFPDVHYLLALLVHRVPAAMCLVEVAEDGVPCAPVAALAGHVPNRVRHHTQYSRNLGKKEGIELVRAEAGK